MANENEEYKKNELEELYAWISKIPLSRSTKNLTRDIADAVMMAEILKIYFPRYVDLHNYVPVNSLTTKKENWNTLNRKVLSKIDMKLTKDIIHQLANCHPGVAEHILIELKNKLLKDSNHRDTPNLQRENKEIDSIGENGERRGPNITSTSSGKLMSCPTNILQLFNYKRSVIAYIAEIFYFGLKWLISWFCIWNHFSNMNFQLKKLYRNSLKEGDEMSGTRTTPEYINEEEVVPRRVCAQLKQELREIDDIICTLNHKVAYLENTMKLKDQRISNLTSQILQNIVE